MKTYNLVVVNDGKNMVFKVRAEDVLVDGGMLQFYDLDSVGYSKFIAMYPVSCTIIESIK